MKILLVEDDFLIAKSIIMSLPKDIFTVTWNQTGEFPSKAHIKEYDIIVLDIQLPQKSGLELLAHIKSLCPDIPTLIITAKKDSKTAEKAFSLGADDFIRKPFGLTEFTYRLQRFNKARSQVTTYEGLSFSSDLMLLKFNDNKHKLSSGKSKYIEFILRNGQIITKRESLRDHLNFNSEKSLRTIDTNISALRKIITDITSGELTIRSHYGYGYRIEKVN